MPRTPQVMAASHFALGDYAACLAEAQTVRHMLPDWVESLTFMIAALVSLDRLGEAETMVAEVLALDPLYTAAYALRRHMYKDAAIRTRLKAALTDAGVAEGGA